HLRDSLGDRRNETVRRAVAEVSPVPFLVRILGEARREREEFLLAGLHLFVDLASTLLGHVARASIEPDEDVLDVDLLGNDEPRRLRDVELARAGLEVHLPDPLLDTRYIEVGQKGLLYLLEPALHA